jgi:methylated-DNA-[protein]-cysteine S-methyltransferase
MFYDYFETGLIGTLTLVADEQGLRHIAFATSRTPLAIHPDWRRDAAIFTEAKSQLRAYFKGERTYFDLPLAPEGTVF